MALHWIVDSISHTQPSRARQACQVYLAKVMSVALRWRQSSKRRNYIRVTSVQSIASQRSSVVAPLYRTLKSERPYGAVRKGTFATGNVSDCRATPTMRPPLQRNRPQNIDIHRFPRHIGYLLIEWAHNLMIRDSSRGKFVCVRAALEVDSRDGSERGYCFEKNSAWLSLAAMGLAFSQPGGHHTNCVQNNEWIMNFLSERVESGKELAASVGRVHSSYRRGCAATNTMVAKVSQQLRAIAQLPA